MQAHDIEALRSLLARCESATRAERELDGDIAEAFGLLPPEYNPKYKQGLVKIDGVWEVWSAPEYTASIDSAIALFEAVLPGWDIQLEIDQDGAMCTLRHPVDFLKKAGRSFGDGPTLPLAIICASLKALIAKTEGAENGTI